MSTNHYGNREDKVKNEPATNSPWGESCAVVWVEKILGSIPQRWSIMVLRWGQIRGEKLNTQLWLLYREIQNSKAFVGHACLQSGEAINRVPWGGRWKGLCRSLFWRSEVSQQKPAQRKPGPPHFEHISMSVCLREAEGLQGKKKENKIRASPQKNYQQWDCSSNSVFY
jgi:hypothetical protein